MSALRVAAVDQGSSATKAAVFGDGLEVLARARFEIATRRDGDRVEHDPEEIWRSVESTLAALAEAGPFDALGLAVQRSSCLLWERETSRPLTPVVSWQDRSQSAACAAFSATAAEEVRKRSGLFLSPHYAALKLRALLAGDSTLRARAARGEVVAGTLDAWLVHRLTGSPSTEPGLAGRSLLYDLERDAWSAELCDAFDIPLAALPGLAPSGGERGVWRDIPLRALLGDQQAALLGHGGWSAGTVAAHFGTGAFVLASTGESLRRHPGLLSAALATTPDQRRFQVEGTVQSAGSALDWTERLVGIRAAALPVDPIDPERLPVVVPAFVGLGAPWWRPDARAWIGGLDLGHDRAAIMKAVLVGIAQRTADNVDAMRDCAIPLDAVRVSGPLAQREDFARLLAELAGAPVEIEADAETGLSGVARLACAMATGGEAPLRVALRSRRIEPVWSTDRRRAARVRWSAALAAVSS